MTGVQVSLDTPFQPRQLRQLELFRARFSELWANWESLKLQGIKIGGTFSTNNGGGIDGPSCGVERHRLKGYYLDFRFFWAKKEDTHFFKVTSLVTKHCSDQRLRRCIEVNKKNWNDAGMLRTWHEISAEEMIQTMFNAKLFHGEQHLQTKLAHIDSMMSDEMAHHLLVSCIYDRMLVIRNLNWMLEPITLYPSALQIPSNFA